MYVPGPTLGKAAEPWRSGSDSTRRDSPTKPSAGRRNGLALACNLASTRDGLLSVANLFIVLWGGPHTVNAWAHRSVHCNWGHCGSTYWLLVVYRPGPSLRVAACSRVSAPNRGWGVCVCIWRVTPQDYNSTWVSTESLRWVECTLLPWRFDTQRTP